MTPCLLIDALVNARHAFPYLLSEPQPSQRHALIGWCGTCSIRRRNPVARATLEILDPGSNPQFLHARAVVARRMATRASDMDLGDQRHQWRTPAAPV